MDCIYFLKDECWAQPFVSGEKGGYYEPTEEEQKEYCKSRANFQYCPRFKAYHDHLKAIGLKEGTAGKKSDYLRLAFCMSVIHLFSPCTSFLQASAGVLPSNATRERT